MTEDKLAFGDDEQDEQIAKAISQRFIDDGHPDGSEVQIHVKAGEAILTGDVDTQEGRQRAEELAAAVKGVRYVVNNLRVGQEGTTGATG